MIQVMTEYDFRRAFESSETRRNHFSYEALTALYEWLDSYEDDTGEPYMFDMIGICCTWTEWENLAEYNEQYGRECADLEEVELECTVIEVGDTGRFLTDEH